MNPKSPEENENSHQWFDLLWCHSLSVQIRSGSKKEVKKKDCTVLWKTSYSLTASAGFERISRIQVLPIKTAWLTDSQQVWPAFKSTSSDRLLVSKIELFTGVAVLENSRQGHTRQCSEKLQKAQWRPLFFGPQWRCTHMMCIFFTWLHRSSQLRRRSKL